MPTAPRAKMRTSPIETFDDPAGDVVAADVPDAAEGDDAERRERREGGDRGHGDVEDVDRADREEALLAQELHEVGDRLQEPEGPARFGP